MNQSAEFQFLENLCIPTMIEVLKSVFGQKDNNFVTRNASLNFSEGQLMDFALSILIENLQFDISNLAKNDPAATKTQNREKYVWESYKGLKAIMYYRIAHKLLDFDNNSLFTFSSGAFSTEEDDEIIKDYMRLLSRQISELAATETTIEINPYANIGKGFVIDHGVGTKVSPGVPQFSTVIGETCSIGDNCTLLNSVLLGASVINEASSGKDGVSVGKRHPTLMNNVTVCAGVRILGNVIVGNNVTIGPCCVVTTDIPDNYNVTIVNQLQYSRPLFTIDYDSQALKPIIHGLTKDQSDYLILFGDNLHICSISIVALEKSKECESSFFEIIIKESNQFKIVFNIQKKDSLPPSILPHYYSLRIKTDYYEYILGNSQVLTSFIKTIMNENKKEQVK